MTNDHILVALSTFAESDSSPLDLLKASGRPYTIHRTGKRITTPELLEAGRAAGVIVASVEPYDAPTIAALPELRCISRCGVGTDNVDLAAARARGIAVFNTPDVPTAAVAELALSMFLSLARALPQQSALMHERSWKRLESHLLGALTVGVIGLGRIGRNVAELTRAFGAKVIGSDPHADAAWGARTGVELVPLEQLIATADIVSLHAARTGGQAQLLDAAAIATMKPGAMLVNLARGGMVDEAALYEALKAGRLSGAGLDVFAEEPYAGPLCDLPNVLLTPHSATLPVETRAAMEYQAVENALHFLDSGGPAERRVA